MDTINIITEIIKRDFNFMMSAGYSFDALKIYNQQNEERIFAKLDLNNDELSRQLTFTIYPRAITEIEIYITDRNTDLSMDFKHYMAFKKGEVVKHVSEFIVDMSNPLLSVGKISAQLKILIENELKDVVFGKEWITFPTYDPRNQY